MYIIYIYIENVYMNVCECTREYFSESVEMVLIKIHFHTTILIQKKERKIVKSVKEIGNLLFEMI